MVQVVLPSKFMYCAAGAGQDIWEQEASKLGSPQLLVPSGFTSSILLIESFILQWF